MKKILVIGANGFTGRRILNDLCHKSTYHVVGSSFRDDLYASANHRSYDFIRADIRNKDELNLLFANARPDVVINTSALSVPDYCETHHEEAYLTNVDAVKQMAILCNQYGSRLIHLSTDFVFEGSANRLYTETDTPCPVNYYGFTKWESEQQVIAHCPNHAIARVAIVYGNALPGQHGNIFQLAANRLRSGEILRVVSDQWRTPTFVGDASRGTELLIESSVNGIFHITGKECLTIADIAYRVADFLKLDQTLIHPVTTQEMCEATPRPMFSGLSIEKAENMIDYHPYSINEGLLDMFG